MRIMNINILAVLFLGPCFTLDSTGGAFVPSKIEIDALRPSIKVGEPFVFRLTYTFEEPVVSERTQGIVKEIWHSAYFRLVREDNGSLLGRYRVYDVTLKLQDEQGLEYAENFMVFYDWGKKKLMFDKSGTYTMQVEGKTKKANPLTINVGPASKADKRAIVLLSEPEDYLFLIWGLVESSERAKRIARFKEVVSKCETTVLAKMAAACLGLEYFKDFHRKHPSFEEFKAKRKQAVAEEPLFDVAWKYLRMGAKLPDDFPIREKVLRMLVTTEWVTGNYEKVYSLLDELETKYPHGIYGKQVPNVRMELRELKKREMEQSQQAKMKQAKGGGLLAVVVQVAIGIFVVALVLVLWLKKKRSSCSK